MLNRRESYRVTWGIEDLRGPIERFVLKLSYIDWVQDELEHFEDGDSVIGTRFNNGRFTLSRHTRACQEGAA